jgi:hypothetical protein
MRTQENPIAAANMGDVLAHRDDPRNRVCARHKWQRGQAVGNRTRQHLAGVGQHHAGLDPHHYAVGRGNRRLDIIVPQIVVRMKPPSFMGTGHCSDPKISSYYVPIQENRCLKAASRLY